MAMELGEVCSCGAAAGSCACQHDFDEDCMNCALCGECDESVDDADICSACRSLAETLGRQMHDV